MLAGHPVSITSIVESQDQYEDVGHEDIAKKGSAPTSKVPSPDVPGEVLVTRTTTVYLIVAFFAYKTVNEITPFTLTKRVTLRLSLRCP